MKHTIPLVVLVFICCCLYAQQPGWQWMASGGGGGFTNSSPSNPFPDQIMAKAFDKDGNIIVGGAISWTPRFDSIYFSNTANWQNSNFFLAKYDKCGNVLWARVGGGNGGDYVDGLDVDEAGNIYVLAEMETGGAGVTIRTPLKDTLINNGNFFFARFSPEGNLEYIKTITGPWESRQMFKRLKNGLFLTVIAAGSGGSIYEGYTLPGYSRNFALFDSLGNFVKAGLIDTANQSGTRIYNFVTDEKDNIYFSITNLTQTSVSFLSHTFNPANPYTFYLLKTDTSFLLKDYNSTGYYNEAIWHLSYSDGYLYGAGRNVDGATFDNDTTHHAGNQYFGVITACKIDTNLNLVWAKRPTIQTIDPQYTYVFGGASKDNLYLGYQHRGNVVWDSASLTVPANNSRMAMLRLRTSDGVCVGGQFANGGNNSKDGVSDIVTDEQGNGYMIGTFNGYIGVPNDSAFAQGGTSSPDYYILKWGLPCSNDTGSLDRPDAPTALTATATGTQTIQVNWGSSTGYQQGYQLYRSPDGVNNWSLVTTTAANVTTYTDGNLTPATTYWYKAAAYNAIGQSGFTNTDSATTLSGQCSAVISYTKTDTLYTFSTTNTGTPGYTYQWSINGTSAGTGATVSTVLNTAGTYNVCVTVTDANQCSSTSCQNITLTGIDNWQTLNVALYPNPTSNVLYVNLTSPEAFKAELTVYDVYGRITDRQMLNIATGSNNFSIATSSWQAGQYIVMLQSSAGLCSRKVIKY
jgi:hypothetical protein